MNNFDFDFNFDFCGNSLDFESDSSMYKQVDICGLAEKAKSKQRHYFDIRKEENQIRAIISNPPRKNECYKMLSFSGGFSSISLIKYIADIERIENLYASTFRIGKKQFNELVKMRKNGKIQNAFFVTSATQAKTDCLAEYMGKKYNYFEYI